jgi:hypothetical protein
MGKATAVKAMKTGLIAVVHVVWDDQIEQIEWYGVV